MLETVPNIILFPQNKDFFFLKIVLYLSNLVFGRSVVTVVNAVDSCSAFTLIIPHVLG